MLAKTIRTARVAMVRCVMMGSLQVMLVITIHRSGANVEREVYGWVVGLVVATLAVMATSPLLLFKNRIGPLITFPSITARETFSPSSICGWSSQNWQPRTRTVPDAA